MHHPEDVEVISSDRIVPNLAATELLLGMLITKLDVIQSGLQEELRADFAKLVSRMRAESIAPIRDLDEIQAVAAKILRAYSG